MLYRHGQAVSKLLAKPSLLGDTLLGRLRSTTFALLGVTTAVGLCAVAFIANQGWPSVFGGSIPSFPSGPRDASISPAPSSASGGALQGRQSDAVPSASQPVGRSIVKRTGSRPSVSRQVAASAPAVPSPTGTEPVAEGAPADQPDPSPISAVPPSTSSPTPTSPAPEPAPSSAQAANKASPGNGNGYGKSKAKGVLNSPSHGKGVPVAKTKATSYEPGGSADAPGQSKPEVAEDPAADDAAVPPLEKSHGSGNGHAYGHHR